MSKEKILKIMGLNSGIALVNIIIFSPGILDISIVGGSAFEIALGITIILVSIAVFILGNFKVLGEKEVKIKTKEIKTTFDCVSILKHNKSKKVFQKEIDTLLEEVQRLEKKKETISEILLEKFNSTEMSYSKFNGVINQVDKIFYLNIKSVVNKINIFDEEDYESTKKEFEAPTISEDIIEEKMKIYNEYISFVKNSIEDNEQILLKLDKVLLELSKFDSLEDGEIEDMEAMQEIDELISKIKFYK